MSARLVRISFALAALVVPTVAGCSDGGGFGSIRGTRRLSIEIKDRDAVTGSRLAPLPLKIGESTTFRIVVRGYRHDGSIDRGFNRFVRLSAKPGSIEPLVGDDTEGRNVLIREGESREIEVKVANAFGTTFILADDLGYGPADPLGDRPPGCANGIDDDGDGKIDFPADEGCAFQNDNSEEGGTYIQGASEPIFFSLPRIADVRGLRCTPECGGTGRTPYAKEQVLIDTGLHDQPDGAQAYDFDVIVTRISNGGFYISDVLDGRGGFNSVFAFNFNAPPHMRVCDRLKTLGGTADEFFGFTQVAYPTWTLEEWDPALRPCLVPDPVDLTPELVGNPADEVSSDPAIRDRYFDARAFMTRTSASLVRVQTTPDKRFTVRVAPKLGPGKVPEVGDRFEPTADATNCDFDGDEVIDRSEGSKEGACANACTRDTECTEWSNFVSRGTFRLALRDADGRVGAVQANASASAGFDPIALKGREIRAFAGTLHFFSGGAQFTIEARCRDDIVLDLGASPIGGDRLCTRDDECPGGFECTALADGQRACRALDAAGRRVLPPAIACVSPRTNLDNDPQ